MADKAEGYFIELNRRKKYSIDEVFQKSGFDVAIEITRFFMRIHGIWPGYVTSKYKILRIFFHLNASMVFYFIIVPQTIQVFYSDGDLNKILQVLMLGDIATTVTFVKLVCVRYYWPVLNQLVITMNEDWNRTKDKDNLNIMWQKSKHIRKVSMIFMAASESTVIVYSLRMSYKFYYAAVHHINGTRPMYMFGKFPYDHEESPMYEITWGLQLISVHLSCGSFAAIDSLFVALVLHLCGQINILSHGFTILVKMDYSDYKCFSNELGKLVKRHVEIARLLNVIESSFNLMFLYQIFALTIVLCLQGYTFIIILADQDTIELIFMIYYTAWFLGTIFIYCYVAELLNDETAHLEKSIFYCGWYNLPAKHSQMLMVPLQRLTRPLELTAGKMCVFSLELFTSVVKRAGGYISMLLAVREKLVQE